MGRCDLKDMGCRSHPGWFVPLLTLLLASAQVACGSEDRPALLSPFTPPGVGGASGGPSGSGGTTSGSGGTTSGNGGTTSGSGGGEATSGTGGDSGSGGVADVPFLTPDDAWPRIGEPPPNALDVGGLGRLDPNEIYLLSDVFVDERCAGKLISHASNTDRALGYLPCDARDLAIDPTTGQVSYTILGDPAPGANVFLFEPDNESVAPFSYNPTPDARANDPRLPYPCDELHGFVVSPNGDAAYACAEACEGGFCTWYDIDGTQLMRASSTPSHMDDARVLIAMGGATKRILLGGSDIGVFHLPDDVRVVRTRARSRGFWMLTLSRTEPIQAELWYADAAGNAESLGAYPPVPPGYEAVNGYVLDDYGNAYYLADQTEPCCTTALLRAAPNAAEPEFVLPQVDRSLYYEIIAGP